MDKEWLWEASLRWTSGEQEVIGKEQIKPDPRMATSSDLKSDN